MKKNFCTLFLLLVLTTQMLPIQQIGSILFSNQINEEVPHSIDLDKGCFKKAGLKSDYLSVPSFAVTSAFIDFTFSHYGFVTAIPQNHTGDIHVPPPNCQHPQSRQPFFFT